MQRSSQIIHSLIFNFFFILFFSVSSAHAYFWKNLISQGPMTWLEADSICAQLSCNLPSVSQYVAVKKAHSRSGNYKPPAAFYPYTLWTSEASGTSTYSTAQVFHGYSGEFYPVGLAGTQYQANRATERPEVYTFCVCPQ